jgi:methyltransferase (TIGR00027 family)
MADPKLRHVSDTAFLVAQCRASETLRPDALFRDPLAARLAGDKGKAILAAFPTAAMTGWTIAIRTVIIDGFLRAALERGCDMVINLGAGLDTRPYRLDLPPELSWVEVDYPDVIAFKEQQLAREQPRCRLERCGLDLADILARQELFAELAARAERPIVLSEGLLPYLDLDEVAALAHDVHAFSRLDAWIVDYISPETHAYRARSGLDRHLSNTPFKFQPPDWFGFFATHGWRPREIQYLGEVGAQLGRRAPLPWRLRLLGRIFRPFIPPERRARLRRFAGYVLLEPAPPEATLH